MMHVFAEKTIRHYVSKAHAVGLAYLVLAYPCVLARALLRRNAHATRAPARFAGSICGTRNLGNRANSLRSNSARF
jgi:hypothetical protein